VILKEFSIAGKVAIVTGAGQGIGKAIALTMAEAGVDVAVVDLNTKTAEQTAAEIRQLGQKALALTANVTKEDQVKEAVAQTIAQFGRIDILVNNAGIGPPEKPVAYIPGAKFPGWELTNNWDKQLTPQEFCRVLDTNLLGAFYFCQAVGPHMLKQKSGKVINISSNSADLGTPYWSPYCVSKAAISMFTRCLSSEWAPYGICVNAIGPGNTKTEMLEQIMKDKPEAIKAALDPIPAGRLGEPREIALLAIYLASDAANFLTGQTIFIDGGQLGRGLGP
jgi:NAD(P)-dependent dehydrogenase (short-subunit alcohol dehydrogenase family)